MNDLSTTIAAKIDQLTADDLIGCSLTIVVTKVSLLADEQPVALAYEGDGGKPFKPCKSMRRVLVNVWGSDGNAYVGRSMTLYRDPKVQFGGMAVGGIRISHMSHIDAKVTMALTATRANKKPFTVHPLKTTAPAKAAEPIASHDPATGEIPRKRTVSDALDELERDLKACRSVADVDAILAEERVQKMQDTFGNGGKLRLNEILNAARAWDFADAAEAA